MKKQKKLTYRVGATALFMSMILLAEEVHGMDLLIGRINTLEGEKKKVETELKVQVEEVSKLRVSIDEKAIREDKVVEEVKALKETLEATQEEKVILEQKHRNTQDMIKEIKRTTGGNGTGTPIIPRLRKLNETAKLLEEKLRAIPGNTMVDKVVVLEETLEAAQEEKEKLKQQCLEVQHQIAEFTVETGEEGGVRPLRKLSNSLKKDTGNLKEAVNALTDTLQGVSGEDCVDKVEGLKTDLTQAQMFLNVVAQKLQGIPGEGLLEKLEVLMAERELTQVILGDMQETIIDKEEAYSDLHIELLRVKSQADYLDEELSKEQVARSETKAQLNHVLGRQFNS